ncbi:MAG: hypothetical protein AB7N70_01445 [Dehalococcoidia bacterium]
MNPRISNVASILMTCGSGTLGRGATHRGSPGMGGPPVATRL